MYLYGGTTKVGFANNTGDMAFRLESAIAAVPEPATLVVFGIGGVCLGGYGWRKRRHVA